ncbi:MAG: hypothetical protein ACPLWB_02850 [Caldisericia bacterium]
MERVLGLTITKNGAKLVETKLRKGKISIVNFKESTIGNKYEKDYKTKFKKFLKEAKIKTKFTSFSLPDEDVLIRVNNYPLMPDEDLRKVILDEISNYKIFQDDYPVVNILRLKVEESRGRYLIVASPRSLIENHIKFLNSIGLEVKNIEIPSIASFRATKIFKREWFKGSGIFIYLSFKKTTLIYFQDGEIFLLREFDIGLDNLSENKINFLNEISNTISYFSREEKKVVEKLILSGIDRGVNEVYDDIKNRFGIETLFSDIIPQKEYFFSAPIGLSLFSFEERTKINLIPKDILEKRKDEIKVFFLVLSNILVGLILIGLSIYLLNSIKTTKDSIKEIDSNLIRVTKSLESLKGIEIEYKNISEKKKELDDVLKNYGNQSLKIYVDEILRNKPQDLNILNFNSSNELNFVLKVSTKNINSIFEFRKNLSQSEIFSEVRLRGIDRGSDGDAFTTIELKGVRK